MGPEPKYLSLFQDNPNLTPAAKQRLEVALIVPHGTRSSGEVGVRTMEGGRYPRLPRAGSARRICCKT